MQSYDQFDYIVTNKIANFIWLYNSVAFVSYLLQSERFFKFKSQLSSLSCKKNLISKSCFLFDQKWKKNWINLYFFTHIYKYLRVLTLKQKPLYLWKYGGREGISNRLPISVSDLFSMENPCVCFGGSFSIDGLCNSWMAKRDSDLKTHERLL